jgi:hypothetical protein
MSEFSRSKKIDELPQKTRQSIEEHPDYTRVLAQEIPESQLVASLEQSELLTEWKINIPLSRKVANNIIEYIRSAEGMRGKYAGLDEIRKQKIRELQTNFPRGKIIWAKPFVWTRVDKPPHGLLDTRKRTSQFYPVKVVDVNPRPFDRKAKTRQTMAEHGIEKISPLADFTLQVLVEVEKGKFEVQDLSFIYVSE